MVSIDVNATLIRVDSAPTDDGDEPISSMGNLNGDNYERVTARQPGSPAQTAGGRSALSPSPFS